MRAVWKYPMTRAFVQIIEMQADAEIVRVENQFGVPCIWALVNPYAVKERRQFGIVPTGGMFEEGRYIGTFMENDGALVWHVIERQLPPTAAVGGNKEEK